MIKQETAEQIAIQSLSLLASNPHNLERFLQMTGLNPATLRDSASEPGFLCSVLLFFVNHEPDLLVLAEHLAVQPQAIVDAHMVLSGGADRSRTGF